MNQIFATVLLLGMVTPAFGETVSIGGIGEIGGSEIIGGIVNACGCDWSDAEYVPAEAESTCLNCAETATAINCNFVEICDDHKAGNSYGVIVGSIQKLTVDCGKWIPPYTESSGYTRAGYWSPLPSVSCDTVATYKCGAGYYGNPTSETSGCTKCPNFVSGGPISSEYPRTSITNCYIMPNKTMSDSTGSYIYTDGCFYEN